MDLVSTGQSPETHFILQGVWQKGSPMHIVLTPGATSQLSSPGFFPSLFYESLPFLNELSLLTPTSAGRGMERKINAFVHFCKTLFWVWTGVLGKKLAVSDHVGIGAGPRDARKSVSDLSSHTSPA